MVPQQAQIHLDCRGNMPSWHCVGNGRLDHSCRSNHRLSMSRCHGVQQGSGKGSLEVVVGRDHCWETTDDPVVQEAKTWAAVVRGRAVVEQLCLGHGQDGAEKCLNKCGKMYCSY